MNRTLIWKAGSILTVVVVSVFGIIGLPKSRGRTEANIEQNVKLGLDLRGGTHLILQVQVQDAAEGGSRPND